MGEYKEITAPAILKLENVGDIIEGIYKGTQKGQFGDLYNIEIAPNEIKTLGSDTVFKNKLSPELVGKKIKIEYLGLKPSMERKGSKYKDYKISVWAE